MNVTTEELLRMIGEQAVHIRLLERRLEAERQARIALARHNKAIPELAQPTPSPEARLVALIRGEIQPRNTHSGSGLRYRRPPRM